MYHESPQHIMLLACQPEVIASTEGQTLASILPLKLQGVHLERLLGWLCGWVRA